MQKILENLRFGEGPRWHDDSFWFSDMHDNKVIRADLNGNFETVLEMTEDLPSGLGWMPDGSLLVVAMESQQVMRFADGELSPHADISSMAFGTINDMIVRSDGTAYVGDMGYQIFRESPENRKTAQLFRVSPDGKVEVAADQMETPNGCILSPDEKTLVVAESSASRLTAFDVEPDGGLVNRRIFAQLPGATEEIPLSLPDGICLDAENAVWVADPLGKRAIRVKEGGEITDELTFGGRRAFACVLAGEDRKTLCVCTAASWEREELLKERTGAIETVRVQVAGAGKP